MRDFVHLRKSLFVNHPDSALKFLIVEIGATHNSNTNTQHTATKIRNLHIYGELMRENPQFSQSLEFRLSSNILGFVPAN